MIAAELGRSPPFLAVSRMRRLLRCPAPLLPCFCCAADTRSFGLSSYCCPAAWGGLNAAEGATQPPRRCREPRPVSPRCLTIPPATTSCRNLVHPPVRPPAPAVVFVHGAGPAVAATATTNWPGTSPEKAWRPDLRQEGVRRVTGDWTRAGLHDLADEALASCRCSAAGRTSTRIGRPVGAEPGGERHPPSRRPYPGRGLRDRRRGLPDFEEQMRLLPGHVFRRLGHPPAALDVANRPL